MTPLPCKGCKKRRKGYPITYGLPATVSSVQDKDVDWVYICTYICMFGVKKSLCGMFTKEIDITVSQGDVAERLLERKPLRSLAFPCFLGLGCWVLSYYHHIIPWDPGPSLNPTPGTIYVGKYQTKC